MAAVGAVGFFKNLLYGNISLATRAKVLGYTGAADTAINTFSKGLFGNLFSLDGIFGIASIALLFMNPATSVFAFGLLVACSGYYGVKALGYGFEGVKCLLKGDIGGFLSNGFTGVMYAISALPLGKLFGQGVKSTMNAVRGRSLYVTRRGIPTNALTREITEETTAQLLKNKRAVDRAIQELTTRGATTPQQIARLRHLTRARQQLTTALDDAYFLRSYGPSLTAANPTDEILAGQLQSRAANVNRVLAGTKVNPREYLRQVGHELNGGALATELYGEEAATQMPRLVEAFRNLFRNRATTATTIGEGFENFVLNVRTYFRDFWRRTAPPAPTAPSNLGADVFIGAGI